MLIGIDFDNTIACYDKLFHKVAVEQGLVPPEIDINKSSVRDYLRQHGREREWTELQGYVYGTRMQEATPFSGVLEFFTRCKERGDTVYIISHRTRYPFQGPSYDLHQAAYEWLASYGFFDPARIGMTSQQVYLVLTKEEKLGRIARAGCTHFIDDLPEFLAEPDFPASVKRILFDPNNNYPLEHHFNRVSSWLEVEEIIMREGCRRC